MAKKKTVPKKPRPLTPKQRRFIANYVQTSNATQSVVEAGYKVADRNVAGSIAVENLQKPAIRAEIERALAENGLTPDAVAKIHHRNMEQKDHLPTSQRAVDSYWDLKAAKEGKTDFYNPIQITIHKMTVNESDAVTKQRIYEVEAVNSEEEENGSK